MLTCLISLAGRSNGSSRGTSSCPVVPVATSRGAGRRTSFGWSLTVRALMRLPAPRPCPRSSPPCPRAPDVAAVAQLKIILFSAHRDSVHCCWRLVCTICLLRLARVVGAGLASALAGAGLAEAGAGAGACKAATALQLLRSALCRLASWHCIAFYRGIVSPCVVVYYFNVILVRI